MGNHKNFIRQKITYFSRPANNPYGGGGARRVNQLYHVLSQDYDVTLISAANAQLPADETVDPHAHWWADKEYGNTVNNLYRIATAWAKNEDLWKSADVFFVDDPMYFYPLITILKKHKKTVIAYLHNIETFVPGQCQPMYYTEAFLFEVGMIRMCDYAIVASREERSMLANMGVPNVYLEYFPVPENELRFMSIRDARSHTMKNGLFVMGTMANKPTFIGTRKIVQEYAKNKLYETIGPLTICGFHANRLKDYIDPNWVTIHANASEELLKDVMVSHAAALMYQEQGAGALNKIPECLLAGIPIVANDIAVRSFYDRKGIFLFSDMEELVVAYNDSVLVEGNDIPIIRPSNCAFMKCIRNVVCKKSAEKVS